jgi:hypothetical protein
MSIGSPEIRAGAGGTATPHYPDPAEQKMRIQQKWAQIDKKQANNIPLNDIEKGFMEKYPKEMLNKQEFVINEGVEIPQGYEATGYDSKGNPMIRKIGQNIASEKFKIEQEEKKKQQEQKSQLVKDSALDSLNTIAEVEKGISNFGLFGQIPSIPGTERATWEANVNKLLSKKVIDVMVSMKEASKTGATGFGQLSEKELKVLQEASTALKRGLSPKDAQRYLNSMKLSLQKITQGNNKTNISLPSEIKTTSQALDYLTKQGMSKDEAIDWIRSQ